jgi:serine phosphatase RsbU (regulator of sigma subunit)/ribosomal protein S4E
MDVFFRNFLITTALLFVFLTGFSQYNEYGNHLITNYSPDEYEAASQNWSIVQDKRGVVYVGNEGAVMEYDGKEWRKIYNNNGSYVKSLAVDAEGTVYVGGVNEFGCIKPNNRGEMRYKELSSSVDTSFRDVWNIFTKKDTVYFCTASNLIFRYHSDSLEPINYSSKYHFLDFMVNETLYIGDYKKGLLKLKENKPTLVKGGAFYENKDIFSILPFRENKLIVTVSNKGAFIYNSKTGKSKSISTLGDEFNKLNDYLKSARVYNGRLLSSGDYLFGTLNDGIIIADNLTGKIKFHYTEKNGLIDGTVINLFESKNENLWLALNNGIAKLEFNSPFTSFGAKDGLKNMPLDLIRYNNDLYAGTSGGIYKMYFNEAKYPKFKQLEGLHDQVRDFVKVEKPGKNQNESIIVGTHRGVYKISESEKLQPIRKDAEKIYKVNVLQKSNYRKNRIFIGHHDGIDCIDYEKGKWSSNDNLTDSVDGIINNIVEVNDSVIWVSSRLRGIYRIVNYNRVEFFDTSRGLPALEKNKVYKIGNRMIIGTTDGFYSYDKKNRILVKDTIFQNKYQNQLIQYLFPVSDHKFIVSYKSKDVQNIELLEQHKDTLIIKKRPFLRLKGKDYYARYQDNNTSVWFSTSDGIYNYLPPEKEKSCDREYTALIREVSLGKDSLLFYGTYYKDTSNYTTTLKQPDALKYQIDYKHNDILFRYSAPYFIREKDIEFSYKLVGYDEKWSNWSKKADKGYTNLDEGQYTFLVKAKNIYGEESEPARFSFTVLPPWYRTIWAYMAYVIVGVFVVVLIVKWYTRRLEKEKIRLEKIVQDRTKEVVKQKNQIEQQRDEIAKKNRDITDSIEYASKIQNAVLPDPEITEEILPEHFIFFRPRDIVSGDFYWISKKKDLLIIIAADCTGHGVPGAFMSMLGVSLLNEIVNKHEVSQANEILTELRSEVKRTLKQKGEEGEAKDGMDIALTLVDLKNMQLQYAGAYNPLFLFRKGKLVEYKADRMPVGIYIKEKPEFTNHVIDLQSGDTFYLFSDGFQDQFGGESGNKFKVKRLKEVLGEIQDKSMAEQKEILEKTFDDWKGDYDQLDDVILIGVRINQ